MDMMDFLFVVLYGGNVKLIDLRSLTLNEMEQFIKEMEEKNFRAVQIYRWINQKNVKTFDEMSDLSKELREKLKQCAFISKIEIKKRLKSSVDNTVKYLFILEKDTIIESVFMKHNYGDAVCISSQAGCKMGCRFCASTANGIDRNLTCGEYAAQIYEIQKDSGKRISNVVVMGCGEPFDNYDNTLKFIKIINSKEGLGLGQRHITISTCGMADYIYDFAAENLQVNLAVSLHAPNDTIRKQIMPIAKRYSMEQTLDACKYYCEKTKRRITYEYALIEGLNDSVSCAAELSKKLKGTLCHVNLICANNIGKSEFRGSSKETAEAFLNTLTKLGIEATIRRKVGTDIEAACGQLRNAGKSKL